MPIDRVVESEVEDWKGQKCTQNEALVMLACGERCVDK